MKGFKPPFGELLLTSFPPETNYTDLIPRSVNCALYVNWKLNLQCIFLFSVILQELYGSLVIGVLD